MTDKRKQTLRTQLGPSLSDQIIRELKDLLQQEFDEPASRYLEEHVLSKYVGPKTASADLRQRAAIDKWLGTEQRNLRTNMRLYGGEADFGFATSEELMEFARRKVLKVIGAEPPLTLMGSFSGGASTRYKREPGSAARKFMGQADVTPEAWPFILPMVLQATTWWTSNPEVLDPWLVEGNVMFTVPKSTDIDRVACKEPELNMFAQKAAGDYFRKRLKRFGIDLNDQSINRELAREGSLTGKLATIDLSSASDSVSRSLVARLLPPGWFVLLDAIRSKRTLIGNEWHENAMFSSMGNGFTFELETLLFWALARAIAFFTRSRGRISVYGDDIIVPVSMAPALARCFNFFGFTVNTRKSRWSGPIRESCGGHYHRGADITPFYIKEPIDNLERLIHFLNRLRRWAGLIGNGICDPRVEPLWSKYAKLVDRRVWGGSNLASPTQLVTPHKARLKLERVKVELDELNDELQLGLYLQSLNANQRVAMSGEPRLAQVVHNGKGHSFAALGVNLLDEAVDWACVTPLISKQSVLYRELETKWRLRKVDPRVDEASWAFDYPVWVTPDGVNL